MNRPIATAIAAIAFGNVGIGSAAAADIPTIPPPEAQVQPPPPDYYASPPVEEGYVYPRPFAYGYPPPPPTSYYEYEAPPVVIIPRPYYLGRHYGPVYGGYPYGVRSYGPHIAHSYGPYDHQWVRGHRGW